MDGRTADQGSTGPDDGHREDPAGPPEDPASPPEAPAGPDPGPQQPSSDTTTIFFATVDTEVDDAPEARPGRLSGDQLRSIDALPARSALLLVQSGANAGARFLLDAEVTTAGRHPTNDIFLDDVTVSRKHAEFVRVASSFVVRDAGSLNGTYVNRDRVESRELSAGDEVQIGKYRLTFHPHRLPS